MASRPAIRRTRTSERIDPRYSPHSRRSKPNDSDRPTRHDSRRATYDSNDNGALLPEEDAYVSYKDLLDRITTISGLLVIASYAMITQPASSLESPNFRPSAVRSFSALSVGLFIVTLVASQVFSYLLQSAKTDTGGQIWFRAAIMLVIFGSATAAMLFFFLTIAAFAFKIGMVFVGLTSIVGTLLLFPWIVVLLPTGMPAGDASPSEVNLMSTSASRPPAILQSQSWRPRVANRRFEDETYIYRSTDDV